MNNQIEYNHIRSLLEHFFEGETSLAEEQELYAFYAQHPHGLPKDLEDNRELLTGFGAIGFSEGEEMNVEKAKRISLRNEHKVLRNIVLWVSTGIAASLLLILGVNTAVTLNENRNLARNYEGSYVIIDGQRIDDLQRIQPDIKKALSQASHIEQHLMEESAIKNAEQNVLNNIHDPEEKARIEDLLNE